MKEKTSKRKTGLPTRIPPGRRGGSILIAETRGMANKRREAEKRGQRRLAKVHEREHPDEEPKSGTEGELQNSILQHPYLNTQAHDGISPDLNPEPPLGTDARREFDNKEREQAAEKQLRLGNMPKFSTAPTPRR